MEGLMMDFPLTLTHLLRRAETFFGEGEIVTRLPDKSFHRTTHGETLRRARQLAVALRKAGLERGDRVATLCWNHYQHHEAYFGVPCGGFVLHTLNLRLHPNDLNYIANHAGDRAVIVDRALLPLLDQFREGTQIEHVWVVEDSYEELLATADPDEWEDPELDEREAAAMCYTSGTTGRPRGVVYSHRSSVLHALGVGANNPLGLGFGVDDAVMPVVPMFHANAWGYPYLATMQGARLVYPGPHLDPDSLLENMEHERVSWAAGVPTIWMGILARLDAEPGTLGPVRDEGDARRRRGGAAGDDRRLRGAARHPHLPGLGDDRDVPGRLHRRASVRPRRGGRRDAAGTSRRWSASRCRSSRSGSAPVTKTCHGTARRWASSRCAARGSPRATSMRLARTTAGARTAGSAPATSSRSTRAASSRSRTARRT